MVDSGPIRSPEPMDQGISRSPLDALRGRAAQTLDDMAYLRWRMGGIAALAIIACLIFYVSKQGEYVPTPEAVEAARVKSGATTSSTSTPPTTAAPEVVVDVAGAVNRPGVYQLTSTARVGDAINAAGGLVEGADRERLNLAERITDGQRIYVTRIGQSAPALNDAGSLAVNPTGATGGKVNINSANATQLDALPGVGPSTAQAIITYRSEHGAFASVDELALVKGIGPSKLAQLKDLASV